MMKVKNVINTGKKTTTAAVGKQEKRGKTQAIRNKWIKPQKFH